MNLKKSPVILFSLLCLIYAPVVQADQPTDTTNKSGETINIQHNNTHLREGPSTTYNITGFADKGQEFQLIAEKDGWVEIRNDEQSGFVLKHFVDQSNLFLSPNGLEDKTIVIDAGHGGRDIGALGATDTYEKNFTYKTMRELKNELEMLDADVLLTRSDDRFASLASRSSFSNMVDTDAFISIHYNSFPEAASVTGIGTYYYHDKDKKLARYVQEELIRKTESENRGTSSEDYHVVRQNANPAVLVELGFISNPKMEEILQSNSYQKKLVSGIVNGLNHYFRNE